MISDQLAHKTTGVGWPTDRAMLTSPPSGLFTELSDFEGPGQANDGIRVSAPAGNVFQLPNSLNGLALLGNPGAPFTLTNRGIAAGAIVKGIESPIGDCWAASGDGLVSLSWGNLGDTSISHQHRCRDDVAAQQTDWKNATSSTTTTDRQEHTVSRGLASGNAYALQLQSLDNSNNSRRTDADYSAEFGRSDDDALIAFYRPDYVNGLVGNERLTGVGSDYAWIVCRDIYGVDGSDAAPYAHACVGLNVNRASAPKKREAAEDDRFTSIENLTGSKWDNTLACDGSYSPDKTDSGTGNDYSAGGRTNDVLRGKVGTAGGPDATPGARVTPDHGTGAAGGVHVQGDTIPKFQNIVGSPPADVLRGGASGNLIEEGGDPDTINSGGAVDTLSHLSSECGVGIPIAISAVSGVANTICLGEGADRS